MLTASSLYPLPFPGTSCYQKCPRTPEHCTSQQKTKHLAESAWRERAAKAKSHTPEPKSGRYSVLGTSTFSPSSTSPSTTETTLQHLRSRNSSKRRRPPSTRSGRSMCILLQHSQCRSSLPSPMPGLQTPFCEELAGRRSSLGAA